MKNNRWYIYQKERFPLLMYIPMILAFSFSAISYSSILRGGGINPWSVVVSFITSLTFFMLLRIADEHKDYGEDCEFRPYRAVPRGLVKLKELFYIGAALIMLQLICALFFNVRLLFALAVLWIYYACMTKEFFISSWLKKHLFVYMFSHMIIMPLLDMYAAACDFLPYGGYAFAVRMIWFVLSSFFDGIVIEVCRKVRAPEDEETGVATYSVLWGRHRAIAVVLGSMALSLISTGVATSRIGGFHIAVPVLGAAFVLCAIPMLRYGKNPTGKNAKLLEPISGIWTIIDYTSLGILPLIFLPR